MTSPIAPIGGGDDAAAGDLVWSAPGEQARTEFVECYDASYAYLVTQLHVISGDLIVAHRCVQEAFARAWRRWWEIRLLPDPVGWVRQVAVRMYDSRRRVRRGTVRAPDLAGADPQNTAMLEALFRLPEPQRRVLVLHYMAGMAVREIARLDHSPVERVEQALAAARTAFTQITGSAGRVI